MKTHRTFVDLLIRSVVAVLLGIGLALLLNSKTVASDVYLDEIKTKTDLYEQVTVTGHNDTDVFIVHSKGMANVKIQDLDPETLWRVGLGEKPVEPGSPEAMAAAEAAANEGTMPAALAKLIESASASRPQTGEGELQEETGLPVALPTQFSPSPDQLKQLMPFIVGALAVAFVLYLFVCYCFKLIVQKTGTRPGIMVWLPILQLIPLLRAAGMSLVWFFFWISPLIVVAAAGPITNSAGTAPGTATATGLALIVGMITSCFLQLITFIVWCVKIVNARGKSGWVTFFLLLPMSIPVVAVINLFLQLMPEQVLGLYAIAVDLFALIAFLYLAFSSAENAGDYGNDETKIMIQSAFSEA